MKIKKLLPYTLVFIIAGCLPVWSLHPLYDDKHQIFDKKLLGTFIEDTNDANYIWEFKHADEPNTYQLIFTGIWKQDPNVFKGWFEVHLIKLNNQFFIDLFPKESPWGNIPEDDMSKIKWYWNAFFMLPVHTFAKIEFVDSNLKICLTDDDDFKKIMKEEPNSVKYELFDKMPVLTASTKELQSFVIKYANDERLFSNKKTLIRKTSAADVNNINDSNNLSIKEKVTN